MALRCGCCILLIRDCVVLFGLRNAQDNQNLTRKILIDFRFTFTLKVCSFVCRKSRMQEKNEFAVGKTKRNVSDRNYELTVEWKLMLRLQWQYSVRDRSQYYFNCYMT